MHDVYDQRTLAGHCAGLDHESADTRRRLLAGVSVPWFGAAFVEYDGDTIPLQRRGPLGYLTPLSMSIRRRLYESHKQW